MPEWDAVTYHRVSAPQWTWGVRVLDRLAPAAGERILDIGCGTGRLTAEIRVRAPSTQVTGMDRSWTMLREASRVQDRAIGFVHADAIRLPFHTGFDAVFSTATFHWIADHDRLFREIHRILVPGGRLVAQSGGGPNLARLYGRAATLAREDDLAPFFAGWSDPWNFAGVEQTHARLTSAGFTAIEVGLESAPTTFPDAKSFSEFIAAVCLRHQLERLPCDRHSQYLSRLARQAADDDPPFTLDYWRLNIDARK